jgi:putative hydrolase of the HAD superfamily
MAGAIARKDTLMAEPVEALLFDFGGVTTDIDFGRVVQRWSELAGRDLVPLWKRYVPGETYHKHERGLISDSAFFASLRDEFQVALTDDEFLDGWNAIFGGILPNIPEQLAAAAAKMPIYAFTNTNAAHEAFWSVAYADMLRPFRRVFVSSTIGLRKPDAEAFAFVAREIGAPPDRILFFDDSESNIRGAKASGFRTVLVRSNADVADALAKVCGYIPQR